MHRRPTKAFHPDVERVEAKQLLSTGASVAHVAHLVDRPGILAGRSARASGAHAAAKESSGEPSSRPTQFLAYRITNPKQGPVNLVPPFQHVLVQNTQPVPGQVYNVLYVAVKNGTAQTFTASNGFTVRLPGSSGTNRAAGDAFPVLTGTEVWKPNTWMVFYVLSKKYYPLSPQVSAGFQLDAGGRISTMIPSPSGIFLRLTYDPATFARTLDWIVAYGPGAEGGAGAKLGLPDTAINELVAASTHRNDFAGHF
jgi:hypothetical protein